MKTCSNCLEEKPASQYHKSARNSGGLYHICKACKKAHDAYRHLRPKTNKGKQVVDLNAPCDRDFEYHMPGCRRMALAIISDAVHQWKKRKAVEAKLFLEGDMYPWVDAAGIDPESSMLRDMIRKLGITPNEENI